MTAPYDPQAAADAAAQAAASAVTNNTKLVTFSDGTVDLYGLGNIGEQGVFTGTAPGVAPSQTYGGQYSAKQELPTQVTTPAYKVMQQYAKMSAVDPNSFASIQSDLYNAGDYGSTKPTWGVWTQHDGLALTQALRGYLGIVQTGVPITFEEWLSKSASLGKADAASTPPSPITITDTNTLQGDANSAGQSLLGRNLSPEEQANFASSFQQKEIDAQEQKNGAKGSLGETILQMPSRYDAAQNANQMIQTQNNPEYQQALQSSYTDAMNQLLGVK